MDGWRIDTDLKQQAADQARDVEISTVVISLRSPRRCPTATVTDTWVKLNRDVPACGKLSSPSATHPGDQI